MTAMIPCMDQDVLNLNRLFASSRSCHLEVFFCSKKCHTRLINVDPPIVVLSPNKSLLSTKGSLQKKKTSYLVTLSKLALTPPPLGQ